LVRTRIRMRLSTWPGPSNKHNSTDSEDSENSEKLTPFPSQFAPCGNGDPAVCFDRSKLLEIFGILQARNRAIVIVRPQLLTLSASRP
jgi:hypothetical protein